MHSESVTLAVGWITTGTGLGNDTKALIFEVLIPLMCGAFVLVVGIRTKSPGPTVIACIFAAIVWGLSADMENLKDKTTDDISEYDGSTVVQGDQ